MALFPGGLLPWLETRFVDASGDALAFGTVSTFEAGTTTPLETYSASDLSIASANPVVMTLDATGRFTDPVYLLPQGYKFTVKDVNGVVQPHYPFDDVEDVGQTFAETIGNVFASGSKSVTSGYTVLTTDRFVTVSSTGGADPCLINLLPAADATQPVCIKNMGTVVVHVVPDGSDNIDSLNAFYVIPVAVSPVFHSILLVSDGVSSWWIQSIS